MESVLQSVAEAQLSEMAKQPWYIRWGISILGTFAALILILTSITEIAHIYGLLSLGFGFILFAFEGTALAKGFNWTFCGILVDLGDKATPLIRMVVYAALSVTIIVMKFSKIFVLLPAMSTCAAYFYLFLLNRETPSDEEPVVAKDEPEPFGDA